jgi:hypothetical protein
MEADVYPQNVMQDDGTSCPVTDQTLGDLYRAGPQGLPALIMTVPLETRAMLAVYCFRRSHLASIGIAIAATCAKEDLTMFGGNAGAMLFDRSRESETSPVLQPHVHGRRKITLATGPIYKHETSLLEDDIN